MAIFLLAGMIHYLEGYGYPLKQYTINKGKI